MELLRSIAGRNACVVHSLTDRKTSRAALQLLRSFSNRFSCSVLVSRFPTCVCVCVCVCWQRKEQFLDEPFEVRVSDKNEDYLSFPREGAVLGYTAHF